MQYGSRQPSKTRRSVLLVLLGALVVSTSAALAAYVGGRDGGVDGWNTVADEPSGITVGYPRDWRIQTFGPYCGRIGPGLLVTNVARHRFRNVEIVDGCTNQWNLAGLPADYVLVDVSLISSPFGSGGRENTEMPLELDRFRRDTGRSFAYTAVVRGGDLYGVRTWTGPGVSPEDQHVLARVIRSVELSDPESS